MAELGEQNYSWPNKTARYFGRLCFRFPVQLDVLPTSPAQIRNSLVCLSKDHAWYGCILRLISFDAYHPTLFCLGLSPKIDYPPLINFLIAAGFNRWLWLYYHFLLFDIFEHDVPFGFLLSFSFSCPIISLSIHRLRLTDLLELGFLAHIHCFWNSTKLKEDIMAKGDFKVPGPVRDGVFGSDHPPHLRLKA